MTRSFSGARLRQARLAAGLSPEQLAVRIDRGVFSINGYERGTRNPSASVLGKLAVALACPIDALYDEAARMPPSASAQRTQLAARLTRGAAVA